MPIKLNKEYTAVIPKENLSDWEVVVLASETCKQLGWQCSVINEKELMGVTDKKMKSSGDHISVIAGEEQITISSKSPGPGITDFGRNKKNIEEVFLPAFNLQKASLSEVQLRRIAEDLSAHITEQKKAFTHRMETGTLTADEKIALGVGGHYATYTIIGLNVLVFAAMVISGVNIISPAGNDLLKWGANYKFYTVTGDWWRLISCVFVHIGIVHLLLNMYALYFIGNYLEPLLGKWKFISGYLCAGVFAGLVSTWWSGDRISAGASGAIFGMYGIFLALLTTKVIERETRKAMMQSIVIFVGYNLIYGMKSGIDNAAHIGGLVSGALIGYVFYFTSLRINAKEVAGKIVSAALVAVTVIIAGFYLSNAQGDEIKFDEALEKINDVEERAIGGFNRLSNQKSDNDATILLQDSIIPAWQEFRIKLNETMSLKLEKADVRKRKLLLDYAELREEQARLILKIISEKNQNLKTRVDSVNAQIENILDSLGN